MQETPKEAFFQGLVRKDDEEFVVIKKANHALALRMASKEAERHAGEWVVRHIEVAPDPTDGNAVMTVLEEWSSSSAEPTHQTQSTSH